VTPVHSLTSPPALLLWAWLAVAAIRALPILDFIEPVSIDVWLVLGACYAAFSAAFALTCRPIWPAAPVPRRLPAPITSLVYAFSATGLIGALARGIDFYFLRGLDYSEGLGAVRLANVELVGEEAGARGLAAIGRILIAFSTVAAMATILRFEALSKGARCAALGSLAVAVAVSILEGGRNTLAINLALMACCFLIRWLVGKPAIPGGLVGRAGLAGVAIVAVVFFSYIFVDRSEALGRSLADALTALEASFNVQVSEQLKDADGGLLLGAAVSLAGLALYVGNGVNELNWVMEWLNANSLAMGAYNLDMPVVALQRMGFDVARFNADLLYRPGVYITAFGELMLDFGVAGTVLILGLIGAAVGRAWYLARRRDSIGMELGLAFAVAWLIATPLYSIVAGFFSVLLAVAVFSLAIAARRPRAGLHVRPVHG